MCKILYDAKTAGIGYTTSMAVKEIRVQNRGMRQTDVLMGRCVMSEDLIKRSDAIKAYNEAMDELVKWQMEEWQLGDFSECEFNTTDCKHIVRKIEAIPSADRPQGEWKPKNHHTDYCSNCGFEETQWRTADYNFCPSCGAIMKGADDD